jgi:hypothetical protein
MILQYVILIFGTFLWGSEKDMVAHQNAKLFTMLLVDHNVVWMPMEDMSKEMAERYKADNKPANVGPQGSNTTCEEASFVLYSLQTAIYV